MIDHERYPRRRGVTLNGQLYEPQGLWRWVQSSHTVPHSRRQLDPAEEQTIRSAAEWARRIHLVRNSASTVEIQHPFFVRRPTRPNGTLVFKVISFNKVYVLRGGEWRLRRRPPAIRRSTPVLILHAVLTRTPVEVEVSTSSTGPWVRMPGTWAVDSYRNGFFQALRGVLPATGYDHIFASLPRWI
jgi:hypothetical protein